MNFLFACGGTGGHINPAIAAAQRLKALLPDCRILFVGAEDNMEMELVPREGFQIQGLRVGNLHRSIKLSELKHNLRSAALLLQADRRARQLLQEFQPDVVLGTGGYVCFPVLRAAAVRRVPTLLHEANAAPGLTTRLLEPYVDQILVAFEESRESYRLPETVRCVGMPVRQGFREQDRAALRQALQLRKPLVLSFGGSLGARRLNEAMVGLAADNEESGSFRLLHAAGSGEAVQEMAAQLRQRGRETLREASLQPYLHRMPQVMAAADLVICRAGASTLGELAAAGKPAILVPYPHATGNHQEKNARLLEAGGAAIVLRDEDCTAQRLSELVRELLSDPVRLERMSAAAKALDRPAALDDIVDAVLKLAQRPKASP